MIFSSLEYKEANLRDELLFLSVNLKSFFWAPNGALPQPAHRINCPVGHFLQRPRGLGMTIEAPRLSFGSYLRLTIGGGLRVFGWLEVGQTAVFELRNFVLRQ